MTRLMRPPESLPQVFLYRDPVDFRKSYRGLGAIVELEIEHNIFDGGLYVFINRQRNKIKCLFWEVCKHCHTSHYARFEIIHSLQIILVKNHSVKLVLDLLFLGFLNLELLSAALSAATTSCIIKAPPETL